MRGNGLSAHTYVAVADLDPGTADVLLAALRERGVAAYAAASPDPVPDSDVDRLYVDVAAVEQARALISVELTADDGTPDDPFPTGELGPEPAGWPDAADPGAGGQLDVDAQFASIVAGFDSPTAGRGGWPAAEDLAVEAPGTGPAPGPGEHPGPRSSPDSPAQDGGAAGPGPSVIGWEDLLRPLPAPEPEPETGYVPPPPAPLPQTSIGTRFAWAAVLGGPAVLFLAVLLGWQLADWAMLVAALSFLGGFVALVARLGDRPDDQDDDGAVV